jgi:hypothetical protein
MKVIRKAYHSIFWKKKYFKSKQENVKTQPTSSLLQTNKFNERAFYKAIENFIDTWS